jgi:uncharacterized membrane protein (UPF0136 family)
MAQITLGIYAVLLALGGVIGYVKAGSRPSLIAGATSALLSLACVAVIATNRPVGLWLGAGLALCLLALFGWRFAKGRKFMPSGLMSAVSLVVLALLVFAALA